MKKIHFGFYVLLLLIFNSCNDPEVVIGTLKLSFSKTELNNTTDLAKVVISVTDASNVEVFSAKSIELKTDGDLLYTDPLNIRKGEYILKTVYLMNAKSEIIYIGKQAGQAPLEREIPLKFTIEPDELTVISPKMVLQ